jgi:hypothetical protein
VASTAYFNPLHAIADSTSHVTATQLPHWKKQNSQKSLVQHIF